jgi:hypothetical protein
MRQASCNLFRVCTLKGEDGDGLGCSVSTANKEDHNSLGLKDKATIQKCLMAAERESALLRR